MIIQFLLRSIEIIPADSNSFSVSLTTWLLVCHRCIKRRVLVAYWPRFTLTKPLPKNTSFSGCQVAKKMRSIHRWRRLEEVFQIQWSIILLYNAIQPLMITVAPSKSGLSLLPYRTCGLLIAWYRNGLYLYSYTSTRYYDESPTVQLSASLSNDHLA